MPSSRTTALTHARDCACLTRRALACLWAAVLAVCLIAPCTSAWADVRGTDVLLGRTVDERGLPAAAAPNVTAQYALLTDDAGKVYFSRDADERVHIASITKVMCAIVALENASLDDIITVSPTAAQVGESTAELQAGDTLTLEMALTGLMVSSGNDAATAIADTLGESMKTSEDQSANDAFVAAMNAKANELGMENTLFANAHGLDIGEFDNEMYSSAADVATMCRYAMQNETFRNIVAQDKAQITGKRASGAEFTVNLQSTDMLLGHYEGACGIKTGYTEQAGQSFAGACNRDGEYLYAIVLGAPSEMGRFEDAEALFDWVYNNRISYALAHSDQIISMTQNGSTFDVPLIAEVPHTAWPDRRVKATLADPQATVDVFAPEGNISQELVYNDLPGTVSVGDVVGQINFYQGNQLVATQDLVAAEDSAAPDLLQGIGLWWDRLWAGFTGATIQAEPVVVNDTPLIYSKSTSQTVDAAAQAASATSADEQGEDGQDAASPEGGADQ